MKFLITTAIVLLVVIGLKAQDAKTILDKAAQKISSYKSIEADFDLTMENTAENIQEKYSGKVYMKGNMYKLDIMDVVTFFDGENIYSYMPEVQEVNVKMPDAGSEELLNPATIFNIHNTGFKQKLVSDQNNEAYIELYPNDLGKNFTKIGVLINTKENFLQKITSFGKDGNNLIITINNVKQPAEIPADSFFTFDTKLYPNVEVIDLR
ncbi:MAG: outer membrane lipoprotein carrier protein LolA [Culturomica sp.]|jgi:outer membrane lipoprotein-sorting protein|nr:outer membrane lipoprotein carrier protein LolA [Culturomica sp.]